MIFDHNVRAISGVLIAVSLGAVLAPLNSTMIAVALPSIMKDFESEIATTSWLVTGYLIVLASIQPIFGKVGDRLGRRKLIVTGLGIFGIASIGASISGSLEILIVFRLIQAIGAGIIVPNGIAVIRETTSHTQRASAFGLIAAALGTAAAIGPALGGLLITADSWPSIFYVNVPIIALALFMVLRFIPKDIPNRSTGSFDMGGAFMLAAGTSGLALLIAEGTTQLDTIWFSIIGVGLAAFLVLFVFYEKHHKDPVIRPQIFRIRAFTAASLGVALSNLAFYTMIIAIPLILSAKFGFSNTKTGFTLMLLSGPLIIFAPLGGRLADRVGRRVPTFLGHGISTIGLALLAFSSDPGITLILACIGISGIGFGLAFASLQTAAIEAVKSSETGVASGVYSTSRYLGGIVGSAMLASLLILDTNSIEGFQSVTIMVAIAALLSTIVVIKLPAGIPTKRNTKTLGQS